MNNEKSLIGYNVENDSTIMESVPLIADDSLIAIAEQAEKRLAALNKTMTVSLKATTELDWCLIGGVPYLQESGATKVARLFGVSSRIKDIRKETRPDGHYLYTYIGEFSVGGAAIEAIGARGSYDEFFTGADKFAEDGALIKAKKTADEVDERDVKLAAYTNYMNNGIKRILPGLRNITTDTLEKAGIDPNKVRGYGFNSSHPKEESGDSADKRADIKRMIDEMVDGDNERFKAALQHYTSFSSPDGSKFEGYYSLNKISEKMMSKTHAKVKKGYDDWKAKQPKGGEDT